MSHAILIPSFISPVTPSAGDKAEAVFLPRLIVSAIYARSTTVYLRMSAFVQYALRNLSDVFQVSLNSSQVVAVLKRNSEALKCLTKVLKDLTK